MCTISPTNCPDLRPRDMVPTGQEPDHPCRPIRQPCLLLLIQSLLQVGVWNSSKETDLTEDGFVSPSFSQPPCHRRYPLPAPAPAPIHPWSVILAGPLNSKPLSHTILPIIHTLPNFGRSFAGMDVFQSLLIRGTVISIRALVVGFPGAILC
jgi:hypothetical protein